jgi:HSP20 family protein
MRELDDFQNRILSAFKPAGARHNGDPDSLTLADWAPMVNISENDAEYLISADLPEVKREDVRVSMENGMLTLTGERKMEKQDSGTKHHVIEQSYGRFVRSFSLPGNIDPSKVEATFKDGVLRVHITKSDAARPKQIEIKVGA